MNDLINNAFKGNNEPKLISDFGTPIEFPIIFNSGVYDVLPILEDSVNSNKTGLFTYTKKAFDEFYLPATSLIRYSRAKLITRTQNLVTGITVKEIYGHDDWSIEIKGVCLNERNRTAREQIQTLLDFEKILSPIRVTSEWLSHIKVNFININEIIIPQLQGKPNSIPFEIRAESCLELPEFVSTIG